jgi:major membrane immunogen (membrane-anchored lipoprotein)
MASIRDLKKDLNYILGEVIQQALDWENTKPDADHKESQKIIDDAVDLFDTLTARIYQNKGQNSQAHFKQIADDLLEKGNALLDRVIAL